VCYWCSQWEHGACAGIKDSESALLDSVSDNILFFCSLCIANVPCALELFQLHSAVDDRIDERLNLENLLKSMSNIAPTNLEPSSIDKLEAICHRLHKSMDEMASKLIDLSSTNSNTSTPVETSVVSQSLSTSPPPRPLLPLATAQTIADELADRARRKNNIIVYNYTEAVDRQTDKESFSALCKNVFDTDVKVLKMIRLEKKEQVSRDLL